MPPKKRSRVQETSSTPKTVAKPSSLPADSPRPADQLQYLEDPWTDEEEILLFKSIIRWKPTGIHKHFRMLAISNALSSHGFTSNATPHTRIPGVWAKLRSLYDLDALDERENSQAGIISPSLTPDPDAENDDDDAKGDLWNHDFELPDDEYGEQMWTRRFMLKEDGSVEGSPELIEGLQCTRSEPGVDLSVLREQCQDSEGHASVKGKNKKTTAGKVAKGKGQRSAPSTPVAEAEVEDTEQNEQEESQTKRKVKPARRTRRR